jgi:hypothetical protein
MQFTSLQFNEEEPLLGKTKVIEKINYIAVSNPIVTIEPIKESLPPPDEFEKNLYQSIDDIDEIDFDKMFND